MFFVFFYIHLKDFFWISYPFNHTLEVKMVKNVDTQLQTTLLICVAGHVELGVSSPKEACLLRGDPC